MFILYRQNIRLFQQKLWYKIPINKQSVKNWLRSKCFQFVKNYYFHTKFLHAKLMFNVLTLYKQSVKIVQAKALELVNFPACALPMHQQNPYIKNYKGQYSYQNWPLAHIFLLWISMCLQSLMKFHHCHFKIGKTKTLLTKKQTDGPENPQGGGGITPQG